eukprot:scaffold869_cov105-Isochrysis_galbana.AAC.24
MACDWERCSVRRVFPDCARDDRRSRSPTASPSRKRIATSPALQSANLAAAASCGKRIALLAGRLSLLRSFGPAAATAFPPASCTPSISAAALAATRSVPAPPAASRSAAVLNKSRKKSGRPSTSSAT